jgi:hypothetical protein
MSESTEQIALFEWARFQAKKTPELNLLFAVPNAGIRSSIIGARMKLEGLRAGVPDMFLPIARKAYHGLAIELKIGKNKITTKKQMQRNKKNENNSQEWWLEELNKQGYYAVVCYGFEEAKNTIINYLKE